MSNWLAQLPKANLGQTTRLLYQAVTELNRVRVLPERRLVLLDLLRSPIYFVTRALEKHYLNQPIALPEQAQKVHTHQHEDKVYLVLEHAAGGAIMGPAAEGWDSRRLRLSPPQTMFSHSRW